MHNVSHCIIGYGYLGRHLRSQLDTQNCWFAGRSQQGDDPGALHLDINAPETWDALDALQGQAALVLYLMIPPGRIDVSFLPQFLERLQPLPITRRILVSSTVVFGQQERVVDADSEVIIDSDRARRQREIETIWMHDDARACCVRLAGIYGPGRVIGRRGIENGEPVNGDPDGWLNLVHIDDAAALLKRTAELEHVSRYELGSDGTPLKRRDYYELLAELLQAPAPRFQSAGEDSTRGRCCNNELTVARTGWLPQHREMREVLQGLLQVE